SSQCFAISYLNAWHTGEPTVEKHRHQAIAGPRSIPSQNHAHQSPAMAYRGRHKVVSRGANIAGLKAISAGVLVQQMIVPIDDVAMECETAHTEKTIIAGKIADQSDREFRHVMSRGPLSSIGQARGIEETRLLHSQPMRGESHSFCE